jgi:hypothetical protein
MARLHAWALAALVVVSAGGCAHWPWESSSDWEIVRSKRLTVYQRTGAQNAATLAALEQSYAMLQASFFASRPLAPVEVLLLDWPDFRRALGGQRTGVTIAELPVKGLYGRRGIVVMYAHDTTSAGAIHRLVHVFLHTIAPRAPLWLHEGFASYAETARYRDDEKEPSACMGQLPQKQEDIPLAELFSLSWSDLDDTRKESKKASSYRFTASSVVDYFTMGDSGKLRDKFADLIAALADGEGTEAALAKVYPGLAPAVLQEKVREHRHASETALRGLCPLLFPVPAEPPAAPDAAKAPSEPAADEEVERLLLGLRMLPRRDGHVDWYPPEMIGVNGGQFGKAPVPK